MRDRFLIPAAIAALSLCVVWLGYGQRADREDLADAQARAQWAQAVAVHAAHQTVRERVLQLPEDGECYYTTVVVRANWQARPEDRELVAWFDAQPELASLKGQTTFHVLTPEAATYQYFVDSAGGEAALPAVFVQGEGGRVLYKVSGREIPESPAVMAGELVELFDKRPWLRIRPWKRPKPCPGPEPCPDPEPGPAPKPAPDRNINVDVKIPDLRPKQPEPEKPSDADFWVILGVAVAAGAGVALVAGVKRRV